MLVTYLKIMILLAILVSTNQAKAFSNGFLDTLRTTTSMHINFKTKHLADIYNKLVKQDNNLKDVFKYFEKNDNHITIAHLKKCKVAIPIQIEFDTSGTMINIGISLFSEAQQEISDDLRRFFERFLLEHFLMEKELSRTSLQTEGVSISYNGNSLSGLSSYNFFDFLPVLIKSNFFSLSDFTSFYNAEWKDSLGNNIQMQFPKRQSLITGLDKKQLDMQILDDLAFYIPDNSNIVKITSTLNINSLMRVKDNVFRLQGKDILTGINSDLYYVKTNGKFELIFNFKKPKVSIRNILLANNIFEDSVIFNIITNLHPVGFRKGLKQIREFFNQDHFLFVGFEEQTSEHLKTVIVIKHKRFDHLHLVSFDFPVKFLEKKNKITIKAQLYTNIRQDNVLKIFNSRIQKPQKSKHKKIKIQIDR